jgi:hypothetical protein
MPERLTACRHAQYQAPRMSLARVSPALGGSRHSPSSGRDSASRAGLAESERLAPVAGRERPAREAIRQLLADSSSRGVRENVWLDLRTGPTAAVKSVVLNQPVGDVPWRAAAACVPASPCGESSRGILESAGLAAEAHEVGQRPFDPQGRYPPCARLT